MKIYATVQLEEGETVKRSATQFANALLKSVGNPLVDTCQVTVTAVATAPDAPPQAEAKD